LQVLPKVNIQTHPRLYIVNTLSKNTFDIIEVINLLSPVVLLKEVDNLIKNKSEKYFFLNEYYMHKDHKQIFWNIVYYFKVLQLPLFVMTAVRNEAKLNHIIDELVFIREMSKNKNGKLTARFSATSESQKSLNNNNFDTSSKKSYVVIDNASSVLSTPTKGNFVNKDWENVYIKM
jgi:hypothetical protein